MGRPDEVQVGLAAPQTKPAVHLLKEMSWKDGSRPPSNAIAHALMGCVLN
jgi:hypothetical protein